MSKVFTARHAMGRKVEGIAMVANDGFSARYDLDTGVVEFLDAKKSSPARTSFMRTLDFFGLSRTVQDRILGGIEGRFPPEPLLRQKAAPSHPFHWFGMSAFGLAARVSFVTPEISAMAESFGTSAGCTRCSMPLSVCSVTPRSLMR